MVSAPDKVPVTWFFDKDPTAMRADVRHTSHAGLRRRDQERFIQKPRKKRERPQISRLIDPTRELPRPSEYPLLRMLKRRRVCVEFRRERSRLSNIRIYLKHSWKLATAEWELMQSLIC